MRFHTLQGNFPYINCVSRRAGYIRYVLTSLPLQNTPPAVGLSKTFVSVPEFSGENSEIRSTTNDNLLKLQAAGLDSDPYNLPKRQWSPDINN